MLFPAGYKESRPLFLGLRVGGIFLFLSQVVNQNFAGRLKGNTTIPPKRISKYFAKRLQYVHAPCIFTYMNNTTTTAAAPLFFLNAAFETATANGTAEATAEHFANLAASLMMNLRQRLNAGQDLDTAARRSVAEHLEAMNSAGDDVKRCLLQDLLQHAVTAAA